MTEPCASSEFHQISWNEQLRADWAALLRLAVAEDLGARGDLTTDALVPEDAAGAAAIVARQAGVVAGLPGVEQALGAIDPRLRWTANVEDGGAAGPGDRIGLVEGPTRGILAAERLVLNLVGRLSGIATLTREYVAAVRGTKARIYDTRKTTPGWRRLEKYAVRCGGGWNHRSGLYEAVLIKDNHLAAGDRCTAAEAVRRARKYIRENMPQSDFSGAIVEIEVDTLGQLDAVLPERPDIVLLDNMSTAELREAVARRDAVDASIELEASGGVNLGTVRELAHTGVERISVGALTHSAGSLDVGLDWLGRDVAEH